MIWCRYRPCLRLELIGSTAYELPSAARGERSAAPPAKTPAHICRDEVGAAADRPPGLSPTRWVSDDRHRPCPRPIQLAVADPERVALGGFPGWVQRADPRSARDGPAPAHQLVPCPLSALVRREPRSGCRGSGRRREELQGNSVRVAEGDPGAVVGGLDPAVHDAELVQARGPPPQFIAVAAGAVPCLLRKILAATCCGRSRRERWPLQHGLRRLSRYDRGDHGIWDEEET